MELWKAVWMIALVFGFCGFSYISFRVIVRGFAEAKSLLGRSGETSGTDKK